MLSKKAKSFPDLLRTVKNGITPQIRIQRMHLLREMLYQGQVQALGRVSQPRNAKHSRTCIFYYCCFASLLGLVPGLETPSTLQLKAEIPTSVLQGYRAREFANVEFPFENDIDK